MSYPQLINIPDFDQKRNIVLLVGSDFCYIPEMSLAETDMKFLAQANSVVRAQEFSLGVIARVNQLHELGLGKPLITRFDAYKNERGRKSPYDTDILVGNMLPLDEKGTRHLVLFISGAMLIIEPVNAQSIDLYQKQTSVNPGNEHVNVVHVQDLKQLETLFDRQPTMGTRIVARNRNPRDRKFFNGAFALAVDVAIKLQTVRDGEGIDSEALEQLKAAGADTEQ